MKFFGKMLFVVVAIAATGCGKAASNGGSSGVLVSSLNVDLSQKSALLVAASLAQQSMAMVFDLNQPYSAGGSLFASDSQGNTTSVSLTSDSSGMSNGLINSKSYIAVATTAVYDGNGKHCGLVMINKATGKTGCTGRDIAIDSDFFKDLQTDSTGNLVFFKDTQGELVRFNATDPNLTLTNITPGSTATASGVHAFAVDADGDVLVDYWTGMDLTTSVLTLYPVSGGSQIISTNRVGSITVINGTGQSNSFYYANSPNGANPLDCGSQYCELVKNGGGTFSLQVAGFTIPMCQIGAGCSMVWVGTTLVESVTPTNGVNWFFTSGGQVNTINGATPASNIIGNLPNKIDKLVGSNGASIVQMEDSSSNTGIYRYNIGTGLFDTIMKAGDYTVTSFDIDSSGNTTISGTRNSDGSVVVGVVQNGSTTITATPGKNLKNPSFLAALH